MRNLFVGVLFLSFVVLAAATPATTKFAWIDMQKALTTVKEGKATLSKLESEVAANKKELETEQNEIQKVKDEFEKKSLVMNEKTKKDKQLEIQSKLLKLQEKYMKYQQELQFKQGKASQDIVEKIATIVEKYSGENGYTYVFESNSLIFKPKGEDITETIIALYDKASK